MGIQGVITTSKVKLRSWNFLGVNARSC